MIKKYSKFLESKEDTHISIYEWFNMLQKENLNNFDLFADRFIGSGYSSKIKDRVNTIFDILSKIDMEDIDSMLVDVYDSATLNYSKKAILTASYYSEPHKYNGAHFFKNIDSIKSSLICDISKSIIHPTLSYYERGIKRENPLRTNHEMVYVTDDIFNCKNFDKSNYNLINIDLFNKKKLDYYDVDIILNSYKAGICINLGNDRFNAPQLVNIEEVENILENKEPMILDYLNDLGIDAEFIYDLSKGKRQFTTTMFAEYSLKILLEK